MQFDPNNKTVQLCAKGMELEGQGNPAEAAQLFQQAWDEASGDFEKFTAAHYVARHQQNIPGKLKWDTIALQYVLQVKDERMKGTYPSLYLNIAKCYEDLEDYKNAFEQYQLAESFTSFLPDDGYGKMIRSGIRNGLERIRHSL